MRVVLQMMGEKELSASLDTIGNIGQDGTLKTELWPEISKIIADGEQAIFNSENALGQYSRWQELSEPYRTRKEKKYPGNKILVASGRLKMAATIPGSPDNILAYENMSMIYGVNDSTIPYAYAHQKGYAPRNLPARTYLHLSRFFQERIIKAVQKYFFEKVGKIVGKGKGNLFRERSIGEAGKQSMEPEYKSMRMGTDSGTVGTL